MAKIIDSIIDFFIRAGKFCVNAISWALDKITSSLKPLLEMMQELGRVIKEMLSHPAPVLPAVSLVK